MDSVLAEIYSTIIPSAPYLIAAYALIWLVLCAFIAMTFTKLARAEKKLALLEEQISESSQH